MTFLGICSAMTFSYGVGRFAGSKLAKWFSSQKNISRFMERSERLSERYGGYAISLSLCLPFLRHATPYVMGMNRMSFRRFMLFAYPSAFVWTLIYFMIGTIVGDQVQQLSEQIYNFGVWVIAGLIAVVLVYLIYKYVRRSRGRKEAIERTM